MFDTVLFDLDGTLTDPFEGISNSIIYALKKILYHCSRQAAAQKIYRAASYGIFFGILRVKPFRCFTCSGLLSRIFQCRGDF